MAQPRTWILTGSPDNHAATAERGHTVIGLKEGRRNFALQIERGDRIVLYATQRMAFAGSIRVTGELYEDRTPIWPGKPGKVDPYPWRFPTAPETVLKPEAWVPAEGLARDLEHVRKWPAEHWKLAFQGQMREVSAADAELLTKTLAEAAQTAAGRDAGKRDTAERDAGKRDTAERDTGKRDTAARDTDEDDGAERDSARATA